MISTRANIVVVFVVAMVLLLFRIGDVTAQNSNTGEVGIMSEQDAHDIAAIIQAAKEDPDTIQLVTKLRHDMYDELNELRKLDQEEILGALKQSMEELKFLDYLFSDALAKKKGATRVLEEMIKDGMVTDPSIIKKYKKNPNLLEQDTRKGVYFQFVSLAVVGGFM